MASASLKSVRLPVHMDRLNKVSIPAEPLNAQMSEGLKCGHLEDNSEKSCSFFETCPRGPPYRCRKANGPANLLFFKANPQIRASPAREIALPVHTSESVAGDLGRILSIGRGPRECAREGSMGNRSEPGLTVRNQLSAKSHCGTRQYGDDGHCVPSVVVPVQQVLRSYSPRFQEQPIEHNRPDDQQHRRH